MKWFRRFFVCVFWFCRVEKKFCFDWAREASPYKCRDFEKKVVVKDTIFSFFETLFLTSSTCCCENHKQ